MAKNTAIIMKFSATLSVEHSRKKIKKNLKLHTSERYYSFLNFENLSIERFLSSLMPSAGFLNFPKNSVLFLI
jgi:hypothetical protein